MRRSKNVSLGDSVTAARLPSDGPNLFDHCPSAGGFSSREGRQKSSRAVTHGARPVHREGHRWLP